MLSRPIGVMIATADGVALEALSLIGENLKVVYIGLII